MIKVDVKPLSVNECWQGRRFKTQAYKNYERSLLYMLPKFQLPNPPYKIVLVFGLSNTLSDIDNPVKPFIDVMQKKYGFNDKHIHEAIISKEFVKKGNEFVKFKIETIT